jgi:hypothetical protein
MQKKQYWINKLREWFKLPNDIKVVFFRNPSEFKHIEIERINPTHKIIIYGTLKRKYSNKNRIKLGKIYLPSKSLLLSFIIGINRYLYGLIYSQEFTIACTYCFSAYCLLVILFSIFGTYLFPIPSILAIVPFKKYIKG